MTKYKGYNIEYNPKPIGNWSFDWDWWHEDYEGPWDNRSGHASSEDDAKAEIDELIEFGMVS